MRQTTKDQPTTTEPITQEPLPAIITALENTLRTPMEELPLLANHVNIDSLCGLFNDDPSGTTTVSFDYHGQHVVVTADTVEIYN